MKSIKTFSLIVLLFATTQAHANVRLPQNYLDSLNKALATNDPFIISSVKSAIAAKYPAQQKAVDEYVAKITTPKKQVIKKIAKAKPAKASKKKETKLDGNIELGINYRSGNTNQENINAATKLIYKTSKLTNTTKLKAYSSKEENVRNNEDYRINNKSDYNYSDKSYSFLELEYINDRFSGFESRTTENAGFGYRFFDKENFKLNSEASLGLRQTKTTDGDSEDNLVQKFSSNLAWNIIDNIKLTEDLDMSFAEDVIITESETALQSKLTERLYLKLGLNVEHISEVPVGKDNTDTYTSLTLGYDF